MSRPHNEIVITSLFFIHDRRNYSCLSTCVPWYVLVTAEEEADSANSCVPGLTHVHIMAEIYEREARHCFMLLIGLEARTTSTTVLL